MNYLLLNLDHVLHPAGRCSSAADNWHICTYKQIVYIYVQSYMYNLVDVHYCTICTIFAGYANIIYVT